MKKILVTIYTFFIFSSISCNYADTCHIVVDKNNVAQKCEIKVYYNGKEKGYNIQNLSHFQKDVFNKLNIFAIT